MNSIVLTNVCDEFALDLARLVSGRFTSIARNRLSRVYPMMSPNQNMESLNEKIEKEDWAGWAKIAQRIEEIEDVAAKSELRN